MATSLLDWISDLLRDSDHRNEFWNDSDRYSDHHGFRDLTPADVHDALALIADDESSYNHGHHYPAPGHWEHGNYHNGADYLRSYFVDNRDHFGHSDWERSDHWGHDHDHDHDRDRDWDRDRVHDRDHDHDRGRDHDRWDDDRDHDRWDNRFERNETHIDRNETNIDNSVHQDIDTGGGRDHHDRGWGHDHDRGGDFNQTIDNDPVTASGHGSVAAGGDIRDSTVTSGNGNVVGDHNQAVTGSDNTTAFGSGDANNSDLSHVRTGDGSAISLGGDAHGNNEDNDTTTSVHSSGSGSTSVNAAGDHGYADNYSDQSEHDDSTRSNYEDHSSTDSHDDINSGNDSRYEDSHNFDSHH